MRKKKVKLLKKAKIIDNHVHLSLNSQSNAKIENLLESMSKNHIDIAIALAAYFPRKSGSIANREIISLAEKHDNIMIFGSLNAEQNIVHGTRELEMLIKNNSIIGIKLYPGYQNFDPGSKNLWPVYRLATDYNIPVMFHGGLVYKSGEMKYAHPYLVDKAAVDFPNLPIIISHLGDPSISEAVAVAHKNPNVYLDFSGLISNTTKAGQRKDKWRKLNEKLMKEKIANAIIDLSGTGKIIFGTDWPISSHESYLDLMEFLEEKLGLDRKEKKEILNGNIKKALGIK